MYLEYEHRMLGTTECKGYMLAQNDQAWVVEVLFPTKQ